MAAQDAENKWWFCSQAYTNHLCHHLSRSGTTEGGECIKNIGIGVPGEGLRMPFGQATVALRNAHKLKRNALGLPSTVRHGWRREELRCHNAHCCFISY